jgi:hypothetical protein
MLDVSQHADALARQAKMLAELRRSNGSGLAGKGNGAITVPVAVSVMCGFGCIFPAYPASLILH